MIAKAPEQSPGVLTWLGNRDLNLNLHDLCVALCLLLVLEGIGPFISPGGWRGMMQQLSQTDDRYIRIVGLVLMLLGTGLLYLIG